MMGSNKREFLPGLLETNLTDEEIDFLKEMMNIGAGNAATALGQILGTRTNITIPEVYIGAKGKWKHLLEYYTPVIIVQAEITGDIRGSFAFIVDNKELIPLINIVKNANPHFEMKGMHPIKSIMSEIGNIIMEAYTKAIHDFCKLKIYHEVPNVKADILRYYMDKLYEKTPEKEETTIVVVNLLDIGPNRIVTYLLMMPDFDYLQKLVNSIENARMLISK
jgi:chemotaxis protein CheC